MLRVPVLADRETLRLRQEREHRATALETRAARSPRRDRRVALGDQPPQPSVIPRADGIALSPQLPRIRRTKREEVGDDKLTEVPVPRKADAPRDGPVVHPMIRRRGIEADEQHRRP